MCDITKNVSRRSVRSPGGFTLVELLTVIAVVGILAAILIPTIGLVRDSAQKGRCLGNQRQIALACLSYAYDNKGRLPATDRSVTPNVRWMYQAAPFLGRAGGDSSNLSFGNLTEAFQCPSDPDRIAAFERKASDPWDYVSYLQMLPVPLSSRESGLEIRMMSQVSDHSRHPMLVCAREVTSAFYKNNERFALLVKGSSGFMHNDGVNVAYYDGSVRYRLNPTWTSIRGFEN